MLDSNDANADKFTAKEGRELIAKWGCLSWNRIPNNVVWNSWQHGEFSYFPDQSTRHTTFGTDDLSCTSDEESTEEEDNGSGEEEGEEEGFAEEEDEQEDSLDGDDNDGDDDGTEDSIPAAVVVGI